MILSFDFTLQGPAHCSSLHFGLGPSDPVLGIAGSELEADVEYTFRLTVSKDGMTPESTNQTVSALMDNRQLFIPNNVCCMYKYFLFLILVI